MSEVPPYILSELGGMRGIRSLPLITWSGNAPVSAPGPFACSHSHPTSCNRDGPSARSFFGAAGVFLSVSVVCLRVDVFKAPI